VDARLEADQLGAALEQQVFAEAVTAIHLEREAAKVAQLLLAQPEEGAPFAPEVAALAPDVAVVAPSGASAAASPSPVGGTADAFPFMVFGAFLESSAITASRSASVNA
jgi:hypothetical protein